jgi:hypothetical protein
VHLQGVIAVATADIQNRTAVEWLDSIRTALPLEVAAPLAVDLDATDREWAFTPGRELQQEVTPDLVVYLAGTESFENLAPLAKVAVRFVTETIPNQRFELRIPLPEPQVLEASAQCGKVDQLHFMATIETKLK